MLSENPVAEAARELERKARELLGGKRKDEEEKDEHHDHGKHKGWTKGKHKGWEKQEDKHK